VVYLNYKQETLMAVAATGKKQTSHWLILILLALAQFMVVLDISIVNVALPSIQRAFSLTSTNLQWIVTAYTLAFGGFLLLGGRNADYFGRRRTFLGGIIVFTLASMGTGLSQSGTMIIIFRALQGLAGAYLSPAALSIVLVTYREGKERNVALSVWGAVAAGGAAFGVLLGGIITQYLSWRWNFFINVPIGLFVVITAMRILPRHEGEAQQKSLDIPGALTVTGGLMLLVYSLTEAPTYGWSSHRIMITLGASILLLAAFIYNEMRLAKVPLMPMRIFRIRNVSGADSLMLLVSAGLFSVFFFTTLYLQDVLRYSPIKTGVDFLVLPVVIAIVATNVPRLIKLIGHKTILVLGPLFVSGGLFWASHLPVHGTYWGNIAPGLILMGIGLGALFVSVTIAATSGVPQHEAGLASGLLNTSQQIGGAVGLAVLTGVVASSTSHYLTSLHLHAQPTAANMAAASVHGFHIGYLVSSTFGIGASLLALFIVRIKKVPSNQSQESSEPTALPA
jgi:EmrB/QacA subfamily drug resistance transporter